MIIQKKKNLISTILGINAELTEKIEENVGLQVIYFHNY